MRRFARLDPLIVRRSGPKGYGMSTVDSSAQDEETKRKHDEELKFKATVRRNKWLGFWAAELLGLEPEATEEYVSSLIAAELEDDGEEEVFRIIRTDFNTKRIDKTDEEIRDAMVNLYDAAVIEIKEVAAEAKALGFKPKPQEQEEAEEGS
jgi:hypothetical protein